MSTLLSDFLKLARGKTGKTLRDIERATGISNAYLSQLESGSAQNPSANVLYKLAKEYGVSYEQLMLAAGHLQRTESEATTSTEHLLMAPGASPSEQNLASDFFKFANDSKRNVPQSRAELAISTEPDSSESISEIVESLLIDADCLDVYPTPLERVASAIGITEVDNSAEDLREHFLQRLVGPAKDIFQSAIQKLRGIADLRKRVIYIAPDNYSPRERFARGHEIGHQAIPWHNIDALRGDDNFTLSPRVRDELEREANFFSAEALFQGRRFLKVSRDYHPDFASIISLSSQYDASIHATARRFVESSDESVALVPYWPSRYIVDDAGHPVLRRGELVPSPKFLTKFHDIELPELIRSTDEWSAARQEGEQRQGMIGLVAGGKRVTFEWCAFWNQHSLLVLVRRKPLVARLAQP